VSYYNGKRNREKTRRSRLILSWAKKLKAIEQLGGRCQVCGETRPWILEFHHSEEENKENQISFLKHLSWEKLVKELVKCELLCRNCHGDVHFKTNFLQLEDEIKNKVVEDNFSHTANHAEILRLNMQGMSQASIAAEVKCALSTVCEVLKSNGIHTFKTKKVIDPLEVIQLRNEGLSNVEIGKRLGIHRFSVPHIIKRWRERNKDDHSLDT
jgi:hypothetical protein